MILSNTNSYQKNFIIKSLVTHLQFTLEATKNLTLYQAALETSSQPETARLEAFIRAILKAPVKLAPKPIRTAKAGTKIMDATTKPVPNNKAPLLFFLTSVDTAIC